MAEATDAVGELYMLYEQLKSSKTEDDGAVAYEKVIQVRFESVYWLCLFPLKEKEEKKIENINSKIRQNLFIHRQWPHSRPIFIIITFISFKN